MFDPNILEFKEYVKGLTYQVMFYYTCTPVSVNNGTYFSHNKTNALARIQSKFELKIINKDLYPDKFQNNHV